MATVPHPVVDALLERSNRLGSDPRNTNYAGGNTSAKGTAPDPVTGADTAEATVCRTAPARRTAALAPGA